MKSLETDNNNHGPGARLDSSAQLSLHHDLILPSDEGTEESFGEQRLWYVLSSQLNYIFYSRRPGGPAQPQTQKLTEKGIILNLF